MILKALSDYYHRLEETPDINIAPQGFEDKPIGFVIVIDETGRFVNLRDTRQGVGRTRKGRPTRVPKGVKKASGIVANLLWDTAPYTLGRALPEKNKDFHKLSARAVKQNFAFIDKIESFFNGFDDVEILSLLAFLKNKAHERVFEHPLWNEIEEGGGNISFMLEGDDQLICQRREVVACVIANINPTGDTQTCAVSGDRDVPAKLHTAIKGVWGAQSSGANIVSFNLAAFRSFQKMQGDNAPIGQRTEFAYTTALNHLLASERQRMQVGDASTVFWALSACEFETDLPDYLAPPKKGEEAVSYGKIRALLAAAKTGITPEESDIPFYVLGLALNASRIAVRFWYDGNVKEIKERIANHFEDIAIVHSPAAPEFLSLFQLLVSTAADRKADNIPPNIGGDFVRSVLSGGIYPRTLFANAIRRCKAEQQINYERAAIIKGFLARQARIKAITNKEVSMALDKDYDNIGYVLGRLFSVLERIQEQAQGRGLNKTIRDTYFGSATSSSLVTFKRLQGLAIHHLAKIRNSGKNTMWLEQLMQEVSGHIPAQGIPSILNLEDQGRFSIGYYHQRQNFFVKNEDKGKGDDE